MRGIGSTFSRLPAARAIVAGAAFLAGAVAPAAHAQQNAAGNGDETAMAIPRIATHSGGVAFPQPLAPSDAARIRRIFALQDRGDIATAAQETTALTTQLLTGAILADRYLGRFERSTQADLTSWLDRYADQPDAPAIHALLLRRLPKGQAAPPAPHVDALDDASSAPRAETDDDPPDRFPPEAAPPPALLRAVTERARDGNEDAALRLIARSRDIGAAQGAVLRGSVAQTLFTQNRDADALDLAAKAMRRTPIDEDPGLCGLIAGLSAWRLDLPDLAVDYFERAAHAGLASASVRAAGAFWAARANQRIGHGAAYTPWLRRAARQTGTFYGLLAQRILGFDIGAASERDTLSQSDIDAIAAMPGGERAFALLQVGERDRAEAEFRGLWTAVKGTPSLVHSLMLVAAHAGLEDLAAQLAAFDQPGNAAPSAAMRVPMPRLQPQGGFRIDPALVYALTRLESNFNARAVSAAGAHGLMQIMPVTARYIAGKRSIVAADLRDPAYNLAIGQRYVSYLAEQDGIAGDLIRTLAAYNSGPGSFARWSGSLHDNGDPLLFMEAIPNVETRNFVRHVLTYTWLYASRMRLPVPSLNALAAGSFPRFTDGDQQGKLAASAPHLH
jgi:soluble lytic murein transglycosylase-like protein